MRIRDKREYLREMVAEKNRWHRRLTREEKELGFLGWHQRGYLPHCDFPGLTQFVTFRVADSMPVSRRGEWRLLLQIEDSRTKRKKLEEYLDRGLGACQFRNIRLARIMEAALLHFHGRHVELLAWCVMPNHVHALIQVWNTPLSKLVQGWKRFVANVSRAAFAEYRSPARRDPVTRPVAPGRRPALLLQRIQWQRDYWDTFMRDERQIKNAIRYIENNPVKAGLCRHPEEWKASSARFRDEYRRLRLMAGCDSNLAIEVE